MPPGMEWMYGLPGFGGMAGPTMDLGGMAQQAMPEMPQPEMPSYQPPEVPQSAPYMQMGQDQASAISGLNPQQQQLYGEYMALHQDEAQKKLDELDKSAKFRRALGMLTETFATIAGRPDIASVMHKQLVDEDQKRAEQIQAGILAQIGQRALQREAESGKMAIEAYRLQGKQGLTQQRIQGRQDLAEQQHGYRMDETAQKEDLAGQRQATNIRLAGDQGARVKATPPGKAPAQPKSPKPEPPAKSLNELTGSKDYQKLDDLKKYQLLLEARSGVNKAPQSYSEQYIRELANEIRTLKARLESR